MSLLLNRTIAAAIWCVLCPFVSAEEELVVHTWGMFTSLQDESGKAVGGINVDDVLVAETLHKIAPGSLLPVGPGGQPTPEEARCHSQVTMRLERAAINFYPAADFNLPLAVEVSSRRGWLTQYLPDAIVVSPEFSRDHIGALEPFFFGSSLLWKGVTLERAADPLERLDSSDEENSPRPARIDSKGEHADSIIYRGVAKEDAPLRVVRAGPELVITSAKEAQIEVPQLWLTEIASNGGFSVRLLHPFNEETAFLVKTPARFEAEDSSPGSLDTFKSGLQSELRRAGLFLEETETVIATLNRVYLQKVGLRLFFVASSKWTENRGQLSLSIRARERNGRRTEVESTRVTVACIELVTPEQRALLARIAAGDEESSVTGVLPKPEALTDDRWQQLHGIYDRLGQFRNALILDEQRRRPGPLLEEFVHRFRLEGYAPKRVLPTRF